MTEVKTPSKLGTSGRKLWLDVTSEFTLDVRELALLGHACRQSDDVAKLEELLAADGLLTLGAAGQTRLSAVVSELRQSRIACAKLLADLDLPDDSGAIVNGKVRQARKASRARWGA